MKIILPGAVPKAGDMVDVGSRVYPTILSVKKTSLAAQILTGRMEFADEKIATCFKLQTGLIENEGQVFNVFHHQTGGNQIREVIRYFPGLCDVGSPEGCTLVGDFSPCLGQHFFGKIKRYDPLRLGE